MEVRKRLLKLLAKAGISGDLEVTDVPHGISVHFDSPNPGPLKITLTLSQSMFDVRLEGEALAVSPQVHTELMDFDVVGILDAVKFATGKK
jgi:hypothetical protein